MMKKPVLKIDNLSKSFGAIKANDNLNLNLFKNEIHALIGPNGSCLLYTSPSPRDVVPSRMPSSA